MYLGAKRRYINTLPFLSFPFTRPGLVRCVLIRRGQDYRSAEKNKVVLYTTGVKVVRGTYDKCLRVKKILDTHMVRYEERDVSMSRDNHRQLADRLGSTSVELPQVFADGLHIGVSTTQPRPPKSRRPGGLSP